MIEAGGRQTGEGEGFGEEIFGEVAGQVERIAGLKAKLVRKEGLPSTSRPLLVEKAVRDSLGL